MKRTFIVLVLAGLAAGAGVAWAHPGERAERRQALRSCVQQAREERPDATKEELRPAVQSCLEAQGISPRFTPEQREQAKACLEQAKKANPDADRLTIRHAARSCLEQAGLVPPLTPEQEAHRAKRLACFEEAKAAHGDDRAAIRQAVRECIRTAG
jgi:hypothetical protein